MVADIFISVAIIIIIIYRLWERKRKIAMM